MFLFIYEMCNFIVIFPFLCNKSQNHITYDSSGSEITHIV